LKEEDPLKEERDLIKQLDPNVVTDMLLFRRYLLFVGIPVYVAVGKSMIQEDLTKDFGLVVMKMNVKMKKEDSKLFFEEFKKPKFYLIIPFGPEEEKIVKKT